MGELAGNPAQEQDLVDSDLSLQSSTKIGFLPPWRLAVWVEGPIILTEFTIRLHNDTPDLSTPTRRVS